MGCVICRKLQEVHSDMKISAALVAFVLSTEIVLFRTANPVKEKRNY